MSEPTNRCVICTKPHTAVVGYLCESHWRRLGQMLADLEVEAAILSAVPSMQQRVGNGKGSLASERAPARLDVVAMNDPRTRGAGQRPPGPACNECWHGSCIDIRAWLDAYDSGAVQSMSILDVLGSWARLVREERDLSDTGAATITGERDLLTRQLEWVAAQAWVDELYADLRGLLVQLRAANGTGQEKPVAVCPVTTISGICGGNVWQQDEAQAVWRRLSDRCSQTWEPAPGRYACDTCGAVWVTDREKAYLKAMIEEAATEVRRPLTEDGRPMQTADEIMRDQGLTRSAFDVRAHRLRKAGQGGVSHGGYYDPAGFERFKESA